MSEDEPDVYRGIGRRTREKRVALGWTLDQLARTSGVSRRMIVSVEQGSVNASIGTLLRLSDALGIGIPSLVAPIGADPMALTPTERGTTLWEGTLGSGERHDSEAHSDGTREVVHVRDGALQIETSSRTTTLDAGDTFVFDGDVDHAYVNLGHSFCRFTLVVFEPTVHATQLEGME